MTIQTGMKAWAGILAALLSGLTVQADPVLPVIPGAVFAITAYGAVGDGATDNTTAIQNTIKAAQAAGGGTVKIPAAAAPYLCGPVSIGSNIMLQVDAGATLQALPYGGGTNAPGTYPLGGSTYTNFISITGSNVGISGPGTIEGNGAAWWAAFNANNNMPHRPYLIRFSNCNFVLIRNVTFQNSPMFHVAFGATSNVTIDGVIVRAPTTSVNTDAIDPSGSHYLIQNCDISTGDDDICLKPQSTFCSDITIRNCTIGTGHGISIGGQTNSGLDGMTVTNCTFNGTDNGLRMKADPTEGGLVQNVTYSNLTMTNVQYPIVFYSYYDQVGNPGATSGSNQTTLARVQAWNATPPNTAYHDYATTTMPTWRNITINNLTATRSGSAPDGYSTIWGLPNLPIANVTLNNVTLNGYAGFEICNATNVQLTGGSSFSGAIVTHNAEVITAQPAGQTTLPGGPAVFTVATLATTTSTGSVTPAYQWTFNGQAFSDGPQPDGLVVSGSASATLTLSNVPPTRAGLYLATVTEALDTYNNGLVANGTTAVAASSVASLAVSSSADPGRLVNVSARAVVGAGASNLIAGFTVGGPANDGSLKEILVRGMGPSLAAFGVTGFVADPVVQVYNLATGAVVAQNDNWSGDATVAGVSAQVGAFPLAGPASPDAALVTSFAPGAYTANVSGGTNGTDIALAEIYDATTVFGPATPRLLNASARALVNPGAGNLILGFVVGGSTPRTFLVRGVGPSLTAYGVPGTLADPTLQVISFGTGAIVAQNDNWSGNPAVAAAAGQVNLFPLTNAQSKDAALLVTLPPGIYTANLSGVNNTSGVALLEIYTLP
jgi:polygalacturonase